MPLQVAYATSSGARTVSMPLHATSSGAQTVSMPLHATSSGVKWRNRFTHLLRAQCKRRQDGKTQVFKAFDLKNNVVIGKCCLQFTVCLEDMIPPQIRNTSIARKLSCVEGCNTCFNEAQPSSHFSCKTV